MTIVMLPCWPDVVEHAKTALPALGAIIAALSYIALVVLLLWAPKLRKRWMRITSRVVGAVGLASILVPLPAILFGIALDLGNPPTESVAFKSSNGQDATLNYSAGFLGRDYTEVKLKRVDSCQHSVIFWHAGPSYLNDVNIVWADDHHLRLSYHARRDDPQHCESTNGDIAIICVPTPWPN